MLLNAVPVLVLRELQSLFLDFGNFPVRSICGLSRDNDVGLKLEILHAE